MQLALVTTLQMLKDSQIVKPQIMTATATNFKRIFYWLSKVPQVTTRTPQFAKLMAYSEV